MLTTAGLHVPVRPLLDVVGNIGAVDPAQKGGKLLNVGVNTGLDKITPVFSRVVHPLITNWNSE